ncbi:MAG: ABC transporter transmembrane domain-containing protein [Ferruginibacter sp.]
MLLNNSTIAIFIRNNKTFFMIALLAGVIGSTCTIFISLSIGSFYQLVFHSAGNKSRILSLIGFHAAKSVQFFFIFYAGLILTKAISDWLFNYCSKVSASKLSLTIRDNLFEYQLNTRFDQFSEKSPAKYLLRYSGDLQAIQNFYIKGTLTFIKDLVLLLVGFYFLFKIEFFLSSLLLFTVPLLFLINFLFNIPIRTLIKEKRDRKSDLLAFVSHCFHAILSVKAFRKEKIEFSRFQKKSEKVYTASVNYFFHYAFVQSVAPVLLYTVVGLAMFLVANNQINISHGDLMAFVLLAILQFSALRRVVKIETAWRAGNISLKKINTLLNKNTETSKFDPAAGSFHSLEFENLHLNETGLQESILNAHIIKGTINYISCRNTEQLIRILLGVTNISKGGIILNNHSLEKFTTAELRNLFSFSSDYLPLYGTDLYDMIARSKKPGRDHKIRKVLDEIGFDTNSNSLTLKASLERNSILLSIQDRKLISLARA